jgi:hypothetical protein
MANSSRRWVIGGGLLAVIAAAAVWWWRQPAEVRVVLDMVDGFAAAEKRSSGPVDVMIVSGTQRVHGEARPAIYMHPTSRLTYHKIQIPEHARLSGWVALKDEVWDKSTDGVLFRVGVSANGKYDEVIARHVDPRNDLAARRWVPIDADLSPYAGRTVDLILNTNTSPPGRNDPTFDFAVWGEPRIVVADRPVTGDAARAATDR